MARFRCGAVLTIRHLSSQRVSKSTHRARKYSSTSKSSTSPISRIPGEVHVLPSGRLLGYHAAGPVTGTPVIYVHGHPDSGLTITGKLESRVAEELNIRWIGPDRPGVGLSTHYDEQEVLDYPSDMQALAEHLNLKEYYLIGTSGGTGFTLACAKYLPHSQLKGVGICAGVGPLEGGFESMSDTHRKALEAWRDSPNEFRQHYETEYVPLVQEEDIKALENRLRGEFEAAFTGEDKDAILEKDTFNMSVNVMRQAWVQGAWAHAKGMEIHWKPWGFALEEVGFPGIKLWYGEKDEGATPTMGKYMASKLEGAVYKEYAGASHYTIWRDGRLQEMLRELIKA